MASESTKTMQKVEKKKSDNNKPVRKKKKKGKNPFQSFIRYCKEVVKELKRVTWPSGKELVSATGAVALFSVVMAVVVGLLDFGLMNLLQLMYRT